MQSEVPIDAVTAGVHLGMADCSLCKGLGEEWRLREAWLASGLNCLILFKRDVKKIELLFLYF